jgi:Xaa-Pro aminopeptidase
MGPILHGLWLDPGRSAVCGNKPSGAQRHLLESTATLLEDTIGFLRPGVTAREAGRFIDERAAKLGFSPDGGPAMWAIYGHSLGSFFMPPYIPAQLPVDAVAPPRMRSEELLEPDMVFTVEVFLTDAEVGTATFEECIIIGQAGNERLSTTPTVFW